MVESENRGKRLKGVSSTFGCRRAGVALFAESELDAQTEDLHATGSRMSSIKGETTVPVHCTAIRVNIQKEHRDYEFMSG